MKLLQPLFLVVNNLFRLFTIDKILTVGEIPQDINISSKGDFKGKIWITRNNTSSSPLAS